jgi:membrane-bound metal-dependent hydrolase YbcI (DUF457 family)
MDPVSHATFGVTLVEALGVRTARETTIARGATMAAILGALSPDTDALVMPFGWDRYLRIHEIGTHTIIGAIGCGLLTAGLVWLFIRRRYWVLALCASVTALSHVLLDLLSSARLKPGWPVVDTVVSFPVVAMADPWLLALCIVGALAVRFTRDPPRGAAVALGLIAAFVVAKGTLGLVALRTYDAATRRLGVPVVARVVEAEWAAPTTWRVSDATSAHLRVWRTSLTEAPRLELAWPRAPEPEVVTRSRSFSTVRNFLASHELTFFTVTGSTPATVLWSDIRFCWKPDAPDAPIACGLWFGGEIGSDGQLLREIVRIGTFTQSR